MNLGFTEEHFAYLRRTFAGWLLADAEMEKKPARFIQAVFWVGVTVQKKTSFILCANQLSKELQRLGKASFSGWIDCFTCPPCPFGTLITAVDYDTFRNSFSRFGKGLSKTKTENQNGKPPLPSLPPPKRRKRVEFQSRSPPLGSEIPGAFRSLI